MAETTAPETSQTGTSGSDLEVSKSFGQASGATIGTPTTQNEINHIAGLTQSGQSEGLISGLDTGATKKNKDKKEEKNRQTARTIEESTNNAPSQPVPQEIQEITESIGNSFTDWLLGIKKTEESLQKVLTELDSAKTKILIPVIKEAERLGLQTQAMSFIVAHEEIAQITSHIMENPVYINMNPLQKAALWEFVSSGDDLSPLEQALHSLADNQIMTIQTGASLYVVYTDNQGFFTLPPTGKQERIPEEALSDLSGEAVNRPANFENAERLATAKSFEETLETLTETPEDQETTIEGAQQRVDLQRLLHDHRENESAANTFLREIDGKAKELGALIQDKVEDLKTIWQKEIALITELKEAQATIRVGEALIDNGTLENQLQPALKIDADGKITSTENEIRNAVSRAIEGSGLGSISSGAIYSQVTAILKTMSIDITNAPEAPTATRDTGTSFAASDINTSNISSAFGAALNGQTPEPSAPEETPEEPSFSNNSKSLEPEAIEIDPDAAATAEHELQRTNE